METYPKNGLSQPTGIFEQNAVTQTHDERIWLDTELSRFDELLRINYDKSLEAFAEVILTEVAEILQAVKAAFFITNFERKVVSAIAGYACTPQTMSRNEFAIGDDLVGYAAKSQQMRYLENVNLGSNSASTGLASINANCIAIVPLVFNDVVYGVIEINCLHALEAVQQELLKRLGRNIASMLQSIRNNARTRRLLEELQKKNNDMVQQEEELRQNLEELQSTQEEMERRQQEISLLLEDIKVKEANLNAIINNSADSIISVDTELNIVLVNNAVYTSVKRSSGIEITTGMSITTLFPPDQYDHWMGLYKRTLSGERISTELTQSDAEGKNTYTDVVFNPIINKEGKIIGASVFSRDITERKNAEMEIIRKNTELSIIEEQLRQNIAELNEAQADIEQQNEAMQNLLESLNLSGNYTSAILDILDDSVLAIDRNYKITIFNEVMRKTHEANGHKIEPGTDVFTLIPKHQFETYKAYYDRAFAGERFTVTESYEMYDTPLHYLIRYNPILNKANEVIGIAVMGRRIVDEESVRASGQNNQSKGKKLVHAKA